MAFSRDKFGLFWSMPPSKTDWLNLHIAGVKRMQLVLSFADDWTLLQLEEAGVTGIALRLNEPDLMSPASRGVTVATIKHMRALSPVVDTVIMGVEPDNPYDLRYGAASWGQQAAYAHRDNLAAMAALLRPLGVRVVSPGWTARGHYRDWGEGLQPGVHTWLEITRNEYDACDLNGFHWYGADGTPYDIEERMRIDLWAEQSARHKPLYVDEVGIDRGTAVERMSAYLKLATALLRTDHSKVYGGAGERVEALVPFVSNGTGIGYSPDLIIADPAAYALVGKFMAGRDFT